MYQGLPGGDEGGQVCGFDHRQLLPRSQGEPELHLGDLHPRQRAPLEEGSNQAVHFVTVGTHEDKVIREATLVKNTQWWNASK